MFINLINNIAFVIALVAGGKIVIALFPQKTLNHLAKQRKPFAMKVLVTAKASFSGKRFAGVSLGEAGDTTVLQPKRSPA